MKAEDVHKMNDDELGLEVANLRSRLYNLKSQSVTEKLENPRQITSYRRDIARLLTEQTRRTKGLDQ